MFKVDPTGNRLVPMEKRRFAELKLGERTHLQEWIAGMPQALGEELLIIQKEFDGFAGTRERLDLLALDKEGALVVIENKLDDSGRDVVWQALKYVAYCSSLTKAQIVEIYERYLDRWSPGAQAVPNLCEFLEIEELDEMVLNEGNEQRLVLIAADFRKEVTATVLWLLGHGVRAQCLQAVPYSYGEDVFIDLRQIIPPPEAGDFMIGMTAKDSEKRAESGKRKHTQAQRHAFWTEALVALRPRIAGFETVGPSNERSLSCGTGVAGFTYSLKLLRSEVRVQLNLVSSDHEKNKWVFDQLEREKEALQDRFGGKLEWRRMDRHKASRICCAHPCEGFDTENWPKMIEWLCDHVARLEKTFSEPLARLNRDFGNSGTKGSTPHEGGSTQPGAARASTLASPTDAASAATT